MLQPEKNNLTTQTKSQQFDSFLVHLICLVDSAKDNASGTIFYSNQFLYASHLCARYADAYPNMQLNSCVFYDRNWFFWCAACAHPSKNVSSDTHEISACADTIERNADMIGSNILTYPPTIRCATHGCRPSRHPFVLPPFSIVNADCSVPPFDLHRSPSLYSTDWANTIYVLTDCDPN
jgi:hypothetical protein